MIATPEVDAAKLLHVLQHALGRDQYGRSRSRHAPPGEDYRNHFCAGEGSDDFVTCRAAVAQGLMREHPPSAISGGDHVFTVTDAGKAYVTANSPAPPKLTRSQKRYRAFIDADCGLSFGQWLKTCTR
jgi:hypothetical protein